MMIHRLLLFSSLLFTSMGLPVLAHNVQVAEDVGATLHIEPNDIAEAGAPTEVWFALTKAGGRTVPLANCDCQLSLYGQPRATPLQTPSLVPVTAEGWSNIPGATITFPDVGAYTLVLQGTPQEGEQFAPFELSFEVTVASRAVTAAPAPTASVSAPADETTTDAMTSPTATSASETPNQVSTSGLWQPVLLGGGLLLAVGIFWGLMGNSRSSGGKS